MSNPLISVVIAMHNSESTIGRALNSITNQTYTNLDIVVVDDFSTDAGKEVVLSYAKNDSRIRYLHMTEDDPERFDTKLNRNINAGFSAKNFGLEQSHGNIITSQDADDASFLNRIEVQYKLLEKYEAIHITTGSVPFNEKYVGKTFKADLFMQEHPEVHTKEEIYSLSQKTKGIIAKISPSLNRSVPFHIKRKRVINKLFWGSLAPYPGTGGIFMIKKEVAGRIRFRKLKDRVWPSFMGRGADRDFNFQIAETFRNSVSVPVPLYMWHTRENNDSSLTKQYEKYLV